MKKRGFLGMAGAAALLLLTSCLGETNNSQSLSGMPGVVTTSKDYKTVIATGGGYVYSKQFETTGYMPGDCLLCDYTVDYSDPLNANAATNGYYYATIGKVSSVDQGRVEYMIGDTTQLMNKEVAIASPLDRGMLVENRMFISSLISANTGQKNNWYLSFDLTQTPEKVNGKNVYTMFIRTTVKEEGKTPVAKQSVLNAYEVSNLIRTLNQKEQDAGNSSYNMKIYYISKIDEKDPTKFTWSSTDPSIFSMEVKKNL